MIADLSVVRPFFARLGEEMAENIKYNPLPSIERFHRSSAQIRCVVGPVGSGKTSGAAFEVVWFVPRYLYRKYGITKSRWAVVRNTYPQLRDTTMRTVFAWFPHGNHHKQNNIFIVQWPYSENGGKQVVLEVELMFRSCDRAEDIDKFKSLELTGYWIDESIEVAEDIKRMLKNRIGRFPQKCPARYGIETTNAPDAEHSTYSQYAWDSIHPGPVTQTQPLENHVGFWQPPRENVANLRPGYYEDLITDYRDEPDWIATYIKNEPGIILQGKLVYANFSKEVHVASQPLIWSKGILYRGWDNSGNCPACVVSQVPTAQQLQILREFYTDREGIVDFSKRVVVGCNLAFPGAEYIDYGDPAGAITFSQKEGGFTSNAQLMKEACGIKVISSDQNFTARTQAVDQLLARRDGLLIDPSCTRLTNGFIGGYCYPEIGTTGTYAEKPVKNKFSHPHDGLQYLAVKLFYSAQPKKIPVSVKPTPIRCAEPRDSWMGV